MHTAKHKQGGASTYGKMSVLRQGRCLWHSGVSLPQAFQPYLEAQCEARQGDRGRKSQARLRMHSLPAQRQGHPRCVIFLLPETSSPKGELFSFPSDRLIFTHAALKPLEIRQYSLRALPCLSKNQLCQNCKAPVSRQFYGILDTGLTQYMHRAHGERRFYGLVSRCSTGLPQYMYR